MSLLYVAVGTYFVRKITSKIFLALTKKSDFDSGEIPRGIENQTYTPTPCARTRRIRILFIAICYKLFTMRCRKVRQTYVRPFM